jgi:YD repeat-containing protein
MVFNYVYNSANQRTAVTNVDGSYWVYGYDQLGSVTSAKRYWSDGVSVAGQQEEYGYDDIGNRKYAGEGRFKRPGHSRRHLLDRAFLPRRGIGRIH